MIVNNIDKSFHTQKIFRVLLNCMAKPGTIGRIEAIDGTEESGFPFTGYMFSVAKTLLDQETLFHVANDSGQAEAMISFDTMAASGSLSDCDYLLTSGDDFFEIERLKRGSWQFPDESATIICQVVDLFDSDDIEGESVSLTLKGPGIKDSKEIAIEGLNPDLIEGLRECNREFPLGIDCILVGRTGKICCIPRSTRFQGVV